MKSMIREFLIGNSKSTSKKLFIAASLFVAFAVSAQQTQQREHREKPTVEQQMKEFDGLNLSKKQQSKLEKLLKDRDAKMEKNHQSFAKNDKAKSGERPEPPKDRKFDQNGKRPQPQKDENFEKGGQNSEMRAKMDKERKEFDTKIQKILTEDQFQKYQANQKNHKSFGHNKNQKIQKNDSEKRVNRTDKSKS